ncbi:hypothetical protein K227x_06840 [Rubripirellula lacrimiformis]|uniref:Uncharacterized protein n=1 Tax=Rubripirellula lacrimiformis TaxID=1930273 RepID=A0A517N5K2_9BACT|nr:hypothetical protein [Rubripirellula lacrimiformis]QDT02308.1 hypothetical protein K227x_06840 [Rubripirellula lacrimiformis]
MAKFYVQSGTLRTIVQAESSRKAALWAVHQAMQQVLPMEEDLDQTPANKSERAVVEGFAVLSRKVTVSERGYDRPDAVDMPTIEVVAEWNQMVTTLDRLEKMLYQAA